MPRPECRFYVYFIKVDGIIRYIGKGTGNRLISHFREGGKSAVALKLHNARYCEGSSAIAGIYADNLTEQDALDLEILEIAKISQRDQRQLWNANRGGGGLTWPRRSRQTAAEFASHLQAIEAQIIERRAKLKEQVEVERLKELQPGSQRALAAYYYRCLDSGTNPEPT